MAQKKGASTSYYYCILTAVYMVYLIYTDIKKMHKQWPHLCAGVLCRNTTPACVRQESATVRAFQHRLPRTSVFALLGLEICPPHPPYPPPPLLQGLFGDWKPTRGAGRPGSQRISTLGHNTDAW